MCNFNLCKLRHSEKTSKRRLMTKFPVTMKIPVFQGSRNSRHLFLFWGETKEISSPTKEKYPTFVTVSLLLFFFLFCRGLSSTARQSSVKCLRLHWLFLVFPCKKYGGKQGKPFGFVNRLIPPFSPKKNNILLICWSGQSFFYPHSSESTSKRDDVSIPQNLQTHPQLTPAK